MKRGYGILLPVFSLPSWHGIGDFGPHAYLFADLLADSGAAYWQLLPLNPGCPENGESPYFSGSSFAINPLLLSLEKLRNDGHISNKELASMPAFPRHTIDYDALRRMKQPLLEKAASRFKGDKTLNRFLESNRFWLDDFALFDVIKAGQTRPWPDWPYVFKERDIRAMDEFVESQQNEIRIRKTLQFFAFTQWQDLRRYCAGRDLRIIGDMPIYVALDSADTWSNPGLFKLDETRRPLGVSGVPPDFFSATGQLWNNPVYDWTFHQKNGFSWWIARMRHLFSLYDSVRIDHFRGLVQYWEIPAGEKTAVNGTWRDVPTYELFDTLMKKINPFPVICEDLGIITDDVRTAMEHYHFPGMKVLQFAFGDDNPHNPYLPHNYDENCVVYTGTHDNLPTAAWLQKGLSDRERSRISRYIGHTSDVRETVWELIELAMQSVADMAIFPLQDILTLDASSRINDPGRLLGNWRWRWDNSRDSADAALKRLMECGKKGGRI
jgi:4-alpha-glucanotransferase